MSTCGHVTAKSAARGFLREFSKSNLFKRCLALFSRDFCGGLALGVVADGDTNTAKCRTGETGGREPKPPAAASGLPSVGG